ncbi:MAG: hypothetical protein EBZ77_16830 [Chitinophagia bacterium]|nr:hypothetical protein [Chitinophagia bacterium]
MHVSIKPQKDVAVTAAQQLPALDTNRHNWAAATANNDLTTMVVTVAPPRSTASQIANLPIVNENELHPEVEANELHAAGRADSNDAGGLLTVYFMRRQ